MKIVLRVFLFAAIVLLTYMCVQSIRTPMRFDDEHKARQAAIAERLIVIRNAQNGFRNMNGTYAGSFAELQAFLLEKEIPFIVKEGVLTDEQLKAGMTEREAVAKGLIKRDTTWILAKDTLLPRGYEVSSLGKVPGFEDHSFELDTATLSSISGYTVPVFQVSVPYDVYLGDLDRQLLINLKDKTEKMKRYEGLRVGSITEINNNAGNWEL
jgi:hypothetical protein